MDKFNRENLRKLREEMDAALAGVLTQYGITFEIGRITFEPNSARAQLTIKTAAAVVDSANGFKLMATMSGLDPDKVTATGFRLVDYRPKARTKPWVIADATGKKFVCNEDYARACFGKKEVVNG